MEILLLEPYYGGSHQAWADGYRRFSRHDVTLLTLPAQFWKWRMQGGAVTLARMIQEQNLQPDVILASDMLDLTIFRALLPTPQPPIALYFHETQLTYPQNSRQNHGWRYGFINYASALVADAVFFNSDYHHDVFFQTVPNMLKHFGDYNELETVERIREKATVLHLGLDLRRFDAHKPTYIQQNEPPLILWNHRWEADKNPARFFNALYRLAERGFDFQVAITGENPRQQAEEFEQARERLGERVLQFGYLPTFADYARLLWQADYVVSSANQEFFGGAIAEAIYCGCVPLLPKRLNYPYLIPTEAHNICLYEPLALLSLMQRHLNGTFKQETAPLQGHISQFDWSVMTPRYDAALEALL